MLPCNCIQKYRKALKGQFGKDTELLNTSIHFNSLKGSSWESLEPLRFKFHSQKADGTPSKKWQRSFVAPNFCPFCGKMDTEYAKLIIAQRWAKKNRARIRKKRRG